jgi:arsenate reductase
LTTVLFACVQNAGRSQMAAALFNLIAHPAKAHALSAGTAPGIQVHPEVIAVMCERGIDLTGVQPTHLTAALAQRAEWLVTMGCGEQCPFVAGAAVEDWPLEDPKGRSLDEVRAIRDDVERRVVSFIDAHGWR